MILLTSVVKVTRKFYWFAWHLLYLESPPGCAKVAGSFYMVKW